MTAFADFDSYDLQGPKPHGTCSDPRGGVQTPMSITYNSDTQEMVYQDLDSGKSIILKLHPCSGGSTPLCIEDDAKKGYYAKAFFLTDPKNYTFTLKETISNFGEATPTPDTCILNAVYKKTGM